MENHINTIDLINAYINNTLSKAERLTFENRLQTDSEFNEAYNDQLSILEGINRVALTTEIHAAKQSYVRAKWMKYIGVSIGVILISVLVYSIIFKTETPQITQPTNTNTIEVVADSSVVEKPSEAKTNTEEVVVEQAEAQIISEEKEVIKTEAPKAKKQAIEENETVAIIEEKTETLKPEPISPELIAFFKSVKKAPQIIEVNTENDFTVTCKEGTVLTIPAKSFVDAKTGKLARGKINLEVTEYYKLNDILLANLSTKSDDKQLETGGMLYLDANKKGKKLKLKPGKRIKMAFNSKDKKDMQLFTGQERSDGVNWRLQDQKIKFLQQTSEVRNIIGNPIEEDVEVSYSVIEEVPLFQKCKEKKGNNARRYCMDNEILKFVESKFNTSIAEDIGLTGAHNINTYFEIEKDGTIGEIKIKASRKELGDEMIRVIESMPKLEPGKQKGKSVKTVYYLPFEVLFKGKTVNQPLITVRSDKYLDKLGKRIDSVSLTGQKVNSNNKREIERYVFGSLSMGWINCDRFVRTKGKKVKYKLKIKGSEGANVKMIFKSISSILPSSKRNNEYDFGLVPEGEDVVLIAIKWNNNKLYLGKKDTNTKTLLEVDLDFKEVTLEELQGELEKLSNSF